LKHRIDDLHWKVIKFLTDNYQTIYLSDFRPSQIIKKLSTQMLKRILLAFRHYEFKRRLEEKCKERGIQLHIVNEAYTSKTCTRCGTLNQTLGMKKVFRCAHCS